jgi:hypothetical protein
MNTKRRPWKWKEAFPTPLGTKWLPRVGPNKKTPIKLQLKKMKISDWSEVLDPRFQIQWFMSQDVYKKIRVCSYPDKKRGKWRRSVGIGRVKKAGAQYMTLLTWKDIRYS